ncbi:hypothetical protein ABT354_12850 [Streptomyces sp. NPDC000594]|uniref:hypothetical protein n=1 Tax=Streptomyces sp. NPDC000594 TaxID=3154261 RepID=UPI0033243BAC
MTGPLRPAFHEGQILAAADLSAAVAHARGQTARHAAQLHDWGIAEGLGLVTRPRTDPLTNDRFVEVSVAPGIAVDGTGREVVVAAPVVLRESDFEEVNGADRIGGELYPVFLTAADLTPAADPRPDVCGVTAGRTRVEEGYRIVYGRLGDERTVAEQEPPPIGADPAEPPRRWLLLLGYVRWENGHFTGVETTARGVAPRGAGVRADTVSSRSGSLALRTGREPQEGKPVLTLSGEDPPSLVFGLYGGAGTVTELMTVAANGNLSIAGSFSGRMSVGSTLVASGTATDGMLLPLPSGVTPEQVADGRVVVHVRLTPRVPPLATEETLYCPVAAEVDADGRVRCRIRLYTPAGPERFADVPGAVDFLVLATVPATAPAARAAGGDGA